MNKGKEANVLIKMFIALMSVVIIINAVATLDVLHLLGGM